VNSSFRALAEACAGRDGEGCTIESREAEGELAAFGSFSDGGGATYTENGTPGFYEGNSATASANATQSSQIQQVSAAPEVVANGSAGGSAQRTLGANASAHADYSSQASVFMRFTVSNASVPWSAQGTGSSTVTADTGVGNFVLYRTSPSFLFIQNIQDQNFNVNGTLAPGTYEMGSGASCAADEPASCTASYSVTFDIDP
jgi:hypothetical protein